MNLVVNADDFGISEEVNKAIAECFEKGYIDRTTIMVNMPYAREAAVIAEKNGFTDRVGIHINLTAGKPLTEGIAGNAYFCDESGQFNAAFYRNTRLRLHMDRKTVNDIYEEIKAQYEEYLRLGFTLRHVDSHHHVHTNYPVLKALKKVSSKYPLESVRLSRNLYVGGSFPSVCYKKFYNRCLKKICRTTTDYFGSFSDAKTYFDKKTDGSTDTVRKFITDNTLEIMVHPMYSEDGILVDTETPFEEENLLYEKIR